MRLFSAAEWRKCAAVFSFGGLFIVGFSINLLTLFALVLAIGTIVGDAIIVVEAVQTRFDERYSSGDVIKAVAEVAERALPNLRVSEDEERIALLDYKQALLDAGKEVNNALYAVESSAKSLAIHRKQYAELERSHLAGVVRDGQRNVSGAAYGPPVFIDRSPEYADRPIYVLPIRRESL